MLEEGDCQCGGVSVRQRSWSERGMSGAAPRGAVGQEGVDMARGAMRVVVACPGHQRPNKGASGHQQPDKDVPRPPSTEPVATGQVASPGHGRADKAASGTGRMDKACPCTRRAVLAMWREEGGSGAK